MSSHHVVLLAMLLSVHRSLPHLESQSETGCTDAISQLDGKHMLWELLGVPLHLELVMPREITVQWET